MEVTTTDTADNSITDAFIHHHWASQSDVMRYMSVGWQEYLSQPSSIPGANEPPMPLLQMFPYHRPEGDKLEGAKPAEGPPGSSLELIREQLLDRYGIGRAVLGHDLAMYTPLTPNPHLAREIARAVNDWTIEEWLPRDPRLQTLIVVPNQTPDFAAAEIERLADREGVVGVLMAANGLSKPFGHHTYHPIYAAAAAAGLPIVIHAGGDALTESLSHTTAGGLPSSYGEFHALRPQGLMTHIGNVIVQGVFDKFPDLKFFVVGGGAAWVPSLFWRFDAEYKIYRREAPWLTKEPSAYLRSNVRVSTYPLDVAPDSGRLLRLLEAFGGFEDLLVYASGYPNWDCDAPDVLTSQLPASWHEKVLRGNADELFRRRPAAAAGRSDGLESVGEMG